MCYLYSWVNQQSQLRKNVVTYTFVVSLVEEDAPILLRIVAASDCCFKSA